ncbi:MAG: hypothetical protein ACXABY_21705 [Candidatus Thorarchaeota archaeon]
MMNEGKGGILAAISTWLQLLGLVVLAAEAVILAAIAVTPESNPLAPWYPVFMLLFLLVLIFGVFFDRFTERRSHLLVSTEGISSELREPISVEMSSKSITKREVEKKLDPKTAIIRQEDGFTFKLPKRLDWSEPRSLTRRELMQQKGLEMSPDHWEELNKSIARHPLGKMILEAKNLLITCGPSIEIQFSEKSSSEVIDARIEALIAQLEEDGKEVDEEFIAESRKFLLEGSYKIDHVRIQNSFIVTVFDKVKAKDLVMKPNLGTVFLTLVSGVIDKIDSLRADEDVVSWKTSPAVTNVLIDNQLRNLEVLMVFRLTESDDKLFLVAMEYSHQTKVHPDAWQDLLDMFDSFRMIR